jgi:hypothetical protein
MKYTKAQENDITVYDHLRLDKVLEQSVNGPGRVRVPLGAREAKQFSKV